DGACAGVPAVKLIVRVVRSASGKAVGDLIVLAKHRRKPTGRIYRAELAIDIDLLELVDQDHRIVPEIGQIAGYDLDLQPLVAPIAQLFHQRASLGAVLLYVRIVSG